MGLGIMFDDLLDNRQALLDYKKINSDFNSVASLSFLKGLTHEFGKKESEISPLYVFEQEIMFDDLFLENKPS